ncbi:MAG: hypothetical protein NTZ24_04090 [Deltaproteobacteria bacterium]|nr:hypothetical protein [Deltaproteobacteria bacterium]
MDCHVFSLTAGVPIKAIYAYIPVFILSAIITVMMLEKKYEDPEVLEFLCGMNIVVNLGTTSTYIYAFF